MSVIHAIEYSKSSKAKCYGHVPCRGSCIDAGTLRYGQTVSGEYGDTVEWRHWGCVTPGILAQLATVQLDCVNGFPNLQREDQLKIRKAIAIRQVDPCDIPETAKTTDSGTLAIPSSNQKKRKAAFSTSSTSHLPASTSSQSETLTPATTQSSRHVKLHRAPEEEVDIDLTQEEEPRDEIYCALTTKIVGVQYYKGLVGANEEVMLVREPHNPYDRNAIQVKNIGQAQVGHIPRNIASKLAPLLDRKVITVEGVMLQGNLTGFSYSLSTILKIYGPSDKRDQLEPLLIWATPRQRGFPPRNGSTNHAVPGLPNSGRVGSSIAVASLAVGGTNRSNSRQAVSTSMTAPQREAVRKQQEALQKAAELKQMLNNLEKVDDEGRRISLLDTLCSTEDILNLPLHPNPPGIKNGDLVVDLLRHQSQALQWCVQREYPVLPKEESDRPVQFWQLRKNGVKSYYYNIATKSPQEAAPTLGRGALCADSMGLGKTLTMLALILATKNDIPPDFSRGTLIVVPLSVLSNWEKQIQEHCTPGSLSSCIYYGTSRSMSPEQLKKFDVIITTYQTVTGEHIGVKNGLEGSSKKRKKLDRTLFEVSWKRVILDEGHTIRNPKTKMALAVYGLTAQRRWVLSGTPIINSPRDLGSILTFLQICRPLDNEDFFKRLLLRPLKDGDPEGAELLRALMSHICIRRTKEMQDSKGNHLIPLPPVEMILVPVTLSDEARVLYDAVEQLSKKRVENYMNSSGGSNPVQANVLSMLTRMRQLALHPGLIPSDYVEQLQIFEEKDSAPAIQITAQDKIRLQGLLSQAIEDSEECPICFSILTDPRITTCTHAFCLYCITEVISRDSKCPMDRRPIGLSDLIEPLPPIDLTQAPIRAEQLDTTGIRAGSSAKIDQLIHLLKLTPPLEKSLVFSQFTSFLDKIAEVLEEQGIPYLRFDGQMSAKRRQETIDRFSIPLEDDQNDSFSATNFLPARSRRRSKSVVDDVDDEDHDFILDDARDSDEDFLDDGDIDVAFSTQKQKGKGKGKGKAQNKTKINSSALTSGFDGSTFGGENPKVLLLSLKAGALGLNLTVANNVYLMDPWWQEGIESQAIDRCNRLGQKKPVHVYQLIAENTVESKVVEIQERKKLLVQQAFSGIKRTETQRQKKEARMQDLIELFGIRRQASSQGN